MLKRIDGKSGRFQNLCALLICGVLVVALGGCGESRWYHKDVRTLPGGGASAKLNAEHTFQFVVLGDTRSGVEVFKRNIQEINLLDPDVVFNTGDLIRGVGSGSPEERKAKTEAMWDEYDQIVKDFEVPLVMVAGNHDVRSPMTREMYNRRYGRTYFSFDHKGVHFIVLDSEIQEKDAKWAQDSSTRRLGAEQLEWLKKDLAASRDARLKFVLLHRPFWQPGGFSDGPFQDWMETVHPLLAQYGVNAVFGGHDHFYRKDDLIDGVQYYTSGGGGVPVEGDPKDGAFHHFCVVTVRGDQWKVAIVKPGSIEPDTVVTSATNLEAYMFWFSTIDPIGVPTPGKPQPIKMSFKNVSGETAEVTVALIPDANSHWTVTPASQTVTVKSLEAGALEFTGTLANGEFAYPAPRFTLTMTAKDKKPFEKIISPAIPPTQVTHCSKTDAAPAIDGKLDDAVWKGTQPLSTFWTPTTEHPTQYPTEVRLAYDAENLYLAMRCHEPNLPGMVVKSTGRESKEDYAWTFLDDCVEIYVDPTFDRKTYYHIVLNPGDGIYDGKGFSAAWTGEFTSKTGREADAWTAEVAVPWKTIGCDAPKPGTKMGFNVARSRLPESAEAEVTQWSPTFAGHHVPTQFGTLIFE
jgi:3',5'-cyclic AMP phosphodiesterase CpdA